MYVCLSFACLTCADDPAIISLVGDAINRTALIRESEAKQQEDEKMEAERKLDDRRRLRDAAASIAAPSLGYARKVYGLRICVAQRAPGTLP